jgi:hypothetical protein
VQFSSEDGKFDELIEFSGAMTIQRADPYVGKDKRSTIDFKVLSWVASGWSEKLGVSVVYSLTEGEDQPVSRIVAEQPGEDFPATFFFDVIFDVRVNNEVVFRRLHGRPVAEHFRQVPPSGNRRLSPTVLRFEDENRVSIRVPNIGVLIGKPRDCNDRSGRILRELAGVPLIRPLGIGIR